MGPFDPNALTPEMSIDVSLGVFHDTHDRAYAAQTKVKNSDITNLPVNELRMLLETLKAGQRLTDAETGPDFMYASSYHDEIRVVDAELQARK